MIGLTITTCKRYKLFEQTIRSFVYNCLDINLFDFIVHYDDSSNEEDRIKMYNILKELFPSKLIFCRKFNGNDFNTKKRHLEIMKLWKSELEIFNLDYVFHLEDDWTFEKNFSIIDGINILKNNDDIGLIGYSWKQKKFPPDLFVPNIINGYWEWYYSDKHELNEPLFLDEVVMETLPKGHWVKYINWPYFGFRPAIHDVKKLSTLTNFNDNMNSFELEFATRFAKKYKSFLHPEQICIHSGNEISAYNLNDSLR